jgi:hypothetical protein
LQTKLAQVQAAMRAGDWPRAFSIASKFARLGPQRAAIMRAQAARLSPAFYRGLGCDPAAIIEAGKAAMRERFGAMRGGQSRAGEALLARCHANSMAARLR